MSIIQREAEVEDQRLLRQFIEEGSQAAFTRLMERHRDLVYSTCRRELGDSGLGDSGLAEDAAQVVFLILARKAGSLRREVVLSGWLFQTARFAAKDLLKRERRQGAREDKIKTEVLDRAEQEQDAAWREVSPWLHESLARLNEKDRLAILLRFFEDMSFAEVALALGQKEDAARHRVNRALEKMRRTLSVRGVVVSAAALGALVAANAIEPVPACAVPMPTFVPAGGFILGDSHLQQLTRGILQAMSIKQNVAMGASLAIICVALGAGAGLAKNTHPVAGTPASPAPPVAEAGQSKKILGAWTSYVEGHPKQTGLLRFNTDGTYRQNMNAAGTAFCTGHFIVKNDVLTVTREIVTINGKSALVSPQNRGATTGKLSYQENTIILDTTSLGHPIKLVLVRLKAGTSAKTGPG